MYSAFGTLAFFSLDGSGIFEAVLEGVTGAGTAKIVPVTTRDGETRLTIQDTNLDFTIRRSNIRLDSNENKELVRAIGGFINDNSGLLIEQVKPEIKVRMKAMVEKVLNDAFSKLPASGLLSNLEGSSGGGGGGNSSNNPVPRTTGGGGSASTRSFGGGNRNFDPRRGRGSGFFRN